MSKEEDGGVIDTILSILGFVIVWTIILGGFYYILCMLNNYL